MLDTNLTSKEESVLRSLLSNLRSEANLRQVDLADRLGKPQSFVSKYESGERRLDLIELREICLVLEISLSDFVKRFESEIE
jgi:transcriptional regulator with XRE-family HTH domain